MTIELDSPSLATEVMRFIDGKIINGVACEASFTHSGGRHGGPHRQVSNRREERQNQSSPYYRPSNNNSQCKK